MDALTNLIGVITLQYIHISHHYVVHLKLTPSYVNYISINPEKERREEWSREGRRKQLTAAWIQRPGQLMFATLYILGQVLRDTRFPSFTTVSS